MSELPHSDTTTKKLIRSNRAAVDEALEKEKRQLDVPWWGVYGSEPSSYNESFRHVLRGSTIEELIEARKKVKGRVYALDVMAPADTLRALDAIDGGIAMTLADARTEDQKTIDSNRNIKTIDGDITKRKPWRIVDDWLREKQADGFDLILCRPIAGWSYVPKDPLLYTTLFNRAWKILSPEGVMLIELPNAIIFEQIFLGWIDLLRNTQGVKIFFDPKVSKKSLRIEKTIDAPGRITFPGKRFDTTRRFSTSKSEVQVPIAPISDKNADPISVLTKNDLNKKS